LLGKCDVDLHRTASAYGTALRFHPVVQAAGAQRAALR
jgi:hypothetical protein